MHSYMYDPVWFKLGTGDRYNSAQHYDISLSDLDLELRTQVCKKAKNLCSNFLTLISVGLTEFHMVLRHVVLIKLLLNSATDQCLRERTMLS